MIIDTVNIGHYTAEEGKVIVPKNMTVDNYYSTESIWLASFDDIENYEEITIEEWEELKKQFDRSNN